MATRRRQFREFAVGMAFLAPNIIGVLIFVVFPVLFSVFLAFTNWDLRRHNMFHDEHPRFVGFDNFVRLITEDQFTRYLGNTLFLMMGIPFAIGGALIAALLLSRDSRGRGKVQTWMVATAMLITAMAVLMAVNMHASAMTILIIGLAGGIWLLGLHGGTAVYRTFFYAPHFTAGVATFLVWKKLFNPQTGPINNALRPVLNALAAVVNQTPPVLVRSGRWLCLALTVVLLARGIRHLRLQWSDGEAGSRAIVLPTAVLIAPWVVAGCWSYTKDAMVWCAPVVLMVLLWHLMRAWRRGRWFPSAANEGFGSVLMYSLALLVAQFVLLGMSAVLDHLPAMASDGLQPPAWIYDYHWAKPSLMLMGLWAAIGSNNMLLYLAALSNVPQELYEASDIDGASPFQRFWHVTWPQLAPTTFFIAVMSTIGGLQGGFEMARTMTRGGPDGATTTLSYFIYREGFETGRLSFAAAVSWALFLLVFVITMINWKFGNRYVND